MAGHHAEVERLRRKIWAVREELLHCQARAEKEMPRPADPTGREGAGALEKGEAIVPETAERQQAEPLAVAPARGEEVEVAVLAKLELQSQLVRGLSQRLALLQKRVAAQQSGGSERGGSPAPSVEKPAAPECPQRRLRAEIRERRRAELERLRLKASQLPARSATASPPAHSDSRCPTQPITAEITTEPELQQTQPIQLLHMAVSSASNETPREGDLCTPRGSSRPGTSTPPPPPPPNSTPRGRPSPGGPPGPPPPAKAKAKAPSAAPPPPKARGKSRPSRPQATAEAENSGEDVEAAEPSTKLVNLHWRASLEPKPNEITAIADPYLGGVVEFLPKWGRERSERCQERLASYETAVGLSAAAAYEAICTPRMTPRHGDAAEAMEMMEDCCSVVATPRTVIGTPRDVCPIRTATGTPRDLGPTLPIEKRERRRTVFTGECRVEELSRHKLREFFQVRSASVDIGTMRELPSGAGVATLIPDAKHRKILDILVRREAMEQRASVDAAVDELLRALRLCDYSRVTPEMLLEFRKVAAAHMDEKAGGRGILSHVASLGEASLQQLEHPHLHRLLYGMLQIPLINTRLECMILEATFDEQVQHCSNNLEVLRAALECLLNRIGPLRSLFAATLRVGNALNQNSNAPVAGYGFKLCTLPKLLELRLPIRKEVSLFHFLLLWMRPEEVDALCSPEAIEALQRAQAARTYTVYQDLLQQLESYARIQQFAETGLFNGDPQAPQDDVADRDATFRLRMADFSARTRDQVAYLWKLGYNIFRAYADFGRFLDDLRLVYPPPKEEREDKKDLFSVFHNLFTTVARVRGEVLEQKLHEDVRSAFNITLPFTEASQAVVTPPVEVAPTRTFGEVAAEPAANADVATSPVVQPVDLGRAMAPATEPVPVSSPTQRGVPVAAVSASTSQPQSAPWAFSAVAVPICGNPPPQRPPSPFRRLPAQEPLGPPPNRPARPLIPVPKSLSWHPLVPHLELPLSHTGAALEPPPPVMSPWTLATSPVPQLGRSPGGGLRQPSPSARLGRKSLTRIANRLASEAMRDHSSAAEDINSTDPATAGGVGLACSLTPKSQVLPTLMLEEAALEGGGPDLQAQIWMELRRRKSHGPGHHPGTPGHHPSTPGPHPSTPGTPQLVVATVADSCAGPEPVASPLLPSPCVRYCPLPRVEEVAEAEGPRRGAVAEKVCDGGLTRSLRARQYHVHVHAR